MVKGKPIIWMILGVVFFILIIGVLDIASATIQNQYMWLRNTSSEKVYLNNTNDTVCIGNCSFGYQFMIENNGSIAGSPICTPLNGLCNQTITGGNGTADGTGGWTNTSTVTSTTGLDVQVKNASGDVQIQLGDDGKITFYKDGDGIIFDEDSILISNGESRVDPLFSTAIGQRVLVDNYFSTGIGYGANITGTSSVAIGYFPKVSATSSGIAIGNQPIASGQDSVAIGKGSVSSGYNSIAMGVSAVAGGGSAFAAGKNAYSAGGSSAAFGDGAYAGGAGSFAFGGNSYVNQNYALALGPASAGMGNSCVAAGYKANCSGQESVAIGDTAKATNTESIAIGEQAYVSNFRGMTFGTLSKATGGYAFGYSTNASGTYSMAFGYDTESRYNYAIALGHAALTTEANQFMIGTASQELNTYIHGNLLLDVDASTDKGLVVQGAASQSANLQEWQDSAGNDFLAVGTTLSTGSNAGTDLCVDANNKLCLCGSCA